MEPVLMVFAAIGIFCIGFIIFIAIFMSACSHAIDKMSDKETLDRQADKLGYKLVRK